MQRGFISSTTSDFILFFVVVFCLPLKQNTFNKNVFLFKIFWPLQTLVCTMLVQGASSGRMPRAVLVIDIFTLELYDVIHVFLLTVRQLLLKYGRKKCSISSNSRRVMWGTIYNSNVTSISRV